MESPEDAFIRKLFDLYDSDANGYLDRVEFGKVVKTMIKSLYEDKTDEEIEEITKESIDKFDLNNNGKIEFDEFRELVNFLIDEKGLSIDI